MNTTIQETEHINLDPRRHELTKAVEARQKRAREDVKRLGEIADAADVEAEQARLELGPILFS